MKIERLGDHATFLSGFAFKSNLFNGQEKGMPIIRIRDVVRGRSDTYYSGEFDERYLVTKGEYLIGMDGEFNLARWDSEPALLNQRVCKIDSLSRDIDRGYLGRFLPAALKKIEDATPFVTVKHLSVKALNEIEIPLPPLAEQKRIAAILDKADAIRRKLQQSLRLSDDFLRSVFLDMFGDPVANPKGWPIVTIRDLLVATAYGTSKKASEAEGQFPCLRMNNITYSGGWNFTSLKYVDLNKNEQSKNLVHAGQLLFNRTNSKELVGKTAVYRRQEPMAFAGYLVRGIANSQADTEYISAYLNLPHGKAVLQGMCKNIIGMANINAEEFKSIRIQKPPVTLQKQFAAVVHSTELKKTTLNKFITESETLFSSLQQRAFRGEL
jgi:type I restriction enzyme S subunit